MCSFFLENQLLGVMSEKKWNWTLKWCHMMVEASQISSDSAIFQPLVQTDDKKHQILA